MWLGVRMCLPLRLGGPALSSQPQLTNNSLAKQYNHRKIVPGPMGACNSAVCDSNMSSEASAGILRQIPRSRLSLWAACKTPSCTISIEQKGQGTFGVNTAPGVTGPFVERLGWLLVATSVSSTMYSCDTCLASWASWASLMDVCLSTRMVDHTHTRTPKVTAAALPRAECR